ncbi:hypothetical protein [Helicobacter cappadocius]|uniref:Periplasmic protein n=1 Tax=Helicobacter cappadocius TaxID=3063998 RepID=A0AA90PYN5_9HELI|nr:MULTISPECIES: hypothetical protein [unclassified Helicobacter]MDO7253043.1 hypothetical protein [Helicobacter sp. faydin-H75]MDP2538968.1 hypothetical protein [Helicobacter sp. faydin-H76]
MPKKLVLFVIGMLVAGLYGYDLQTWKTNPPPLSLDSFPFLPQIYSFSSPQEPFNPPFLPPLKTYNNDYLEGVLPQVLPTDFLSPEALNAEISPKTEKKEFLISYELYIKDGIAKGERYNISEPIKSRINSTRYEFDYQCRIDTYIGDFLGDDDESYALKVILEAKKDAVLECLYKSGVKVRDDSFINHLQATSKTTLFLPARSVQAYLDNSFLILEVYKEKK